MRGFRAEDIGTTELDECVDFSETFQRMLHKNRVFNRWRCRTPSEHATWAAFVDRGGPLAAAPQSRAVATLPSATALGGAAT